MLLNFGIFCPWQLEGGKLEWIMEFRTLSNENLALRRMKTQNDKFGFSSEPNLKYGLNRLWALKEKSHIHIRQQFEKSWEL
jgi:hypothetical protein